jgi:hypothetical protein
MQAVRRFATAPAVLADIHALIVEHEVAHAAAL